MKKKLLTAAILGALTVSATSVFASPITFSGDGYIQYNNKQGSGVYNGFDSRIRLNVDGDIDENLRAHARLVQENDITTGYAQTKQLRFDQAYIAAKLGQVDVVVGKDSLATGKGLLIDDHGFSGIKAATNVDGFKMSGFYGKNGSGTDTRTVDLGTSFNNVNLGVNFVNFGTDHFYGINADTQVGDAVLNAEYVKNSTSKAKGYIAGVSAGNYTVSYRNIEPGAVTGHTTNGNYEDSKGFKVTARYDVTKNSSITLYQDFAKNHAGNADKHRTNIEYGFNF